MYNIYYVLSKAADECSQQWQLPLDKGLLKAIGVGVSDGPLKDTGGCGGSSKSLSKPKGA